ncbi:MAG TPA: FeoA family protein [Spirochaetota bacterium]|nr:FeoA family protein [Spirochaetota bacterium]HPI87860.1 FeoA family protein [Spirochaetota bacterium]HPR47408.1 FeoA family protein [Spirochaetota bacterium]
MLPEMKNILNSHPLSHAQTNEEGTIVFLDGGDIFKRKLINLGLIPGVKIKVASATRRGPFIIQVNDTRLIIGRGMVEKIYIEG